MTPPDDRDRGGEDLFEDLDKYFAPIDEVDWPEGGESVTLPESAEESVTLPESAEEDVVIDLREPVPESVQPPAAESSLSQVAAGPSGAADVVALASGGDAGDAGGSPGREQPHGDVGRGLATPPRGARRRRRCAGEPHSTVDGRRRSRGAAPGVRPVPGGGDGGRRQGRVGPGQGRARRARGRASRQPDAGRPEEGTAGVRRSAPCPEGRKRKSSSWPRRGPTSHIRPRSRRRRIAWPRASGRPASIRWRARRSRAAPPPRYPAPTSSGRRAGTTPTTSVRSSRSPPPASPRAPIRSASGPWEARPGRSPPRTRSWATRCRRGRPSGISPPR